MICIRIFKTREEAQRAKSVLEKGGIPCQITEDTFNKVPIQRFGVQARFRLRVADEDFVRATNFLAKLLRSRIPSKSG
jgi:hypothetical protein